MCENEFSHISLLLYISTAFSLSLRESEVRALVGSLRKSPGLLACRRKSRWRLSGRSGVADLGCCSVSRDSRHLGLIRRLF